MNSCGSTELSACAPPFRMFIIGTGSKRGLNSAQIAIKRRLLRGGFGSRGCHRDGENRIGAEPAFVRRTVDFDHLAIDCALLARVHALKRRP